MGECECNQISRELKGNWERRRERGRERGREGRGRERESAWAAARHSHPWEESQLWNLSTRPWLNRKIWSGKFHAWNIPTHQHTKVSSYQQINILTCQHIALWLLVENDVEGTPSYSYLWNLHVRANGAICQPPTQNFGRNNEKMREGIWNFFDISNLYNEGQNR